MRKKFRKSAIDLTDLAIGILILGIVVFIGARILVGLRDTRLTSLDTFQTANETLTGVTEAGVDLAIPWVVSMGDCQNETTNAVIATNNYTITDDSLGTTTIAFGLGGEISINNTDWTCTYDSYNVSRPDWDLPNSAAAGIGEYGNWFDIIIIVGIAGLILALIFMAFGRRGEETGGTLY